MNYLYSFLTLSMLLGSGSCYYIGSSLYQEIEKAQSEKEKLVEKAIDQGTEQVVLKTKALYAVVESLQQVSHTKKTRGDIEIALKDTMAKNNMLISCSIAYAPSIYNDHQELMSCRVVRTGDTFTTYALESKEDYTNAEWYRHAQSGTPYWSAPFADEVSTQLIVRYSYPFFMADPNTGKQNFSGIINVAIPVQELDLLVLEVSLDKKTSALLVHENGTLLAHPTEIVTHEEKSLITLARQPGNKNLLLIYNDLKNADEGDLTLTNGVQNNLFKVMFKKIPTTPWYLIIMHLENEKMISSHHLFRLFVLLILTMVLLIATLFSCAALYWCRGIRAAWFTSSFCACVLAASIAVIWALDITSDIPNIQYENIIENKHGLQRFFFLQKKANPHIYSEKTAFIPTGIYITSFATGHDGSLVLNGHVWQKYDRTLYPDLEPNIQFLNATEQSKEKIYTTHKGTLETIGWSFTATIQANFNYLKYPFDEQQIVLELGHQDYLTNVILTPDLEAYVSYESPKSEIDPTITSNQWIIQQSYAFYELTHFTTDFGIEGYNSQKGFPLLKIGIRIRRQFVYPLTASALPVTIILFVVFSILLFTGLTEHHTSLATEIIKLTSSIFFAAAVAHQTFQRSLQSSVITYFEYFYFLIYAIILLVAINGMLYAYNRGGRLINGHRNLIPRLLYWPVTLLLCLLLTLWFFY